MRQLIYKHLSNKNMPLIVIWRVKSYRKQTFQDQTRALDVIRSDPELSSLLMIQAPLVDVEIRGVPALKFLGDIIWKWLITQFIK
jgi:hypothetical protein